MLAEIGEEGRVLSFVDTTRAAASVPAPPTLSPSVLWSYCTQFLVGFSSSFTANYFGRYWRVSLNLISFPFFFFHASVCST